jgi:hypothetical protein
MFRVSALMRIGVLGYSTVTSQWIYLDDVEKSAGARKSVTSPYRSAFARKDCDAIVIGLSPLSVSSSFRMPHV